MGSSLTARLQVDHPTYVALPANHGPEGVGTERPSSSLCCPSIKLVRLGTSRHGIDTCGELSRERARRAHRPTSTSLWTHSLIRPFPLPRRGSPLPSSISTSALDPTPPSKKRTRAAAVEHTFDAPFQVSPTSGPSRAAAVGAKKRKAEDQRVGGHGKRPAADAPVPRVSLLPWVLLS